MLQTPIHLEHTAFYATPPTGLQTLNGLLNAWLPFKDSYRINGMTFAELYEKHQLSKVDSYHDTRVKRFQALIQKELLLPLLDQAQVLTSQKQLMPTLCQWLIKHATSDCWQQLLSNRLTFREYVLEGRYEHDSSLTLGDNQTITLTHRFCFRKKRNSDQALNHNILFRGESQFTLALENNVLTPKETNVYADLFALDMKAAFTQPTLDESINAYILSHSHVLHKEEIEILYASRDYYLNKITSQELQQHFISTNVYSEKFEQSQGYDLLKTILNEKPIDGFSLKK